MVGNRNISKAGKKTRFTSTNQPSNRGRKPKLYTIAKKTYDITLDEYRDVEKYLIQCTQTEIQTVIDDTDSPIWVVNIAKALQKDTSKGVMYALRDIEERIFGKELAKLDVTSNGKEIDTQIVFSPTPLTEKDIQEIKDIQSGKKSSDNTGVPEA